EIALRRIKLPGTYERTLGRRHQICGRYCNHAHVTEVALPAHCCHGGFSFALSTLILRLEKSVLHSPFLCKAWQCAKQASRRRYDGPVCGIWRRYVTILSNSFGLNR